MTLPSTKLLAPSNKRLIPPHPLKFVPAAVESQSQVIRVNPEERKNAWWPYSPKKVEPPTCTPVVTVEAKLRHNPSVPALLNTFDCVLPAPVAETI